MIQKGVTMSKRYKNEIPTNNDFSVNSVLTLVRDYMKIKNDLRPKSHIPFVPSTTKVHDDKQSSKAIWFGHSAVLLEIEGKKVLFDPMFGPSSSPFPIFTSKRYSGPFSMEHEELQEIDAIFISHNHYDHLDYSSILKLKDRTKYFFVPKGVKRYLLKWGVAPEKISEYSWWDEFEWNGLTIACTPARHFSGRGLFDRDCSLWCSWVVLGKNTKVYFSGDSGYAPHFKEIGGKYGPFDLTFMECGQYNDRWSSIHMIPEETVQAHIDVKGNILVPIHWGTFTLSLHEWSDPIHRVTSEAKKHGVSIATPRLGETIIIGSTDIPQETWWNEQ